MNIYLVLYPDDSIVMFSNDQMMLWLRDLEYISPDGLPIIGIDHIHKKAFIYERERITLEIFENIITVLSEYRPDLVGCVMEAVV